MHLEKVTSLDSIKTGDTLIITGDTLKNKPVKVYAVKVSPADGTEIIISKQKNSFFNLGMYLEGKSWVKDVMILK
ncbi:MAG: hypothetical protein IPH04_14550 [Saprospirales bacterium]|nr:hypothetical protein [Saprospirales bacterium]